MLIYIYYLCIILCTVTVRVQRATEFGTKETFRLSRVYFCQRRQRMYNLKVGITRVCHIFILYYIIFFCAYRVLGENDFSGTCMCAFWLFHPTPGRRKCSPYTGLYIYICIQYSMSCAERTKNNPNRDLLSWRYML